MRDMVFSEKEPEDKTKLKNGLVGVAVLLIIGSLSPTIISEFTGVDLDTLCEDVPDDAPDGTEPNCLEEGDVKKAVLEGLGYVAFAIALCGFGGLVIVGVKY